MLGRATGAVLVGVEARLVEVEVDLAGGLPSIAALGLPDSAVREGIDRIRSALRHAGFRLPEHRVVFNLAPAEVRKQGAGLDLPMAVALLLADEQIPRFDTARSVMVGELGLDGTLRPTRGVLSIALSALRAGRRSLLLPSANVEEASLVEGLQIVPLGGLSDVVAYARGRLPARECVAPQALLQGAQRQARGPDLSDVRGQLSARRALEIAAAGGHHLLLCGPPGSGKSMLARRLPGILPPLGLDEALEVTRVWSVAGLGPGLVAARPFRAPHHGISQAGLIGGGARLRPGEISLASNGVLYLDELTEFRRDTLEALRQPLEEGRVLIVRVAGAAELPADFTLVASMNPCPCGYYGGADGRCRCTPSQILRHRARLSGPLLDRFDMVVEVPAVDLRTMIGGKGGEGSREVRRRVVAARERQQRRAGRGGPPCNGRLGSEGLRRVARLDEASRRLLLSACARLGLSARGFDRVRRVARTIADLAGREKIGAPHVAEALQYRPGREFLYDRSAARGDTPR